MTFKEKKGLTLIELLISISILSLISIIGWNSLNFILKNREIIEKKNNEIKSIQMSLTQMQVDLSNIFIQNDKNGIFFFSNGFTFLRFIYFSDLPTKLQRVIYHYDKNILYRTTSATSIIFDDINYDFNEEKFEVNKFSVRLIEDINFFKLFIWKDEIKNFIEEEKIINVKKLPKAIQIELNLRKNYKIRKILMIGNI